MAKDKFPSNHPYSAAKFVCPCCRSMQDQFKSISKFQKLMLVIAAKSKKYFPITSAYRCLTHNKKIGGAQGSDHLSMLAIDIGYESATDLFELIKGLVLYGEKYRYIRIYKNHVHVSLHNPQLKLNEPDKTYLAVNCP